MKKKIALAALSFVSAAVLAACSSAPGGSSDAAGNKIGDTVKIGYNLELSGDVAAVSYTHLTLPTNSRV